VGALRCKYADGRVFMAQGKYFVFVSMAMRVCYESSRLRNFRNVLYNEYNKYVLIEKKYPNELFYCIP
jgi:hypothetical protein